MCFNSKRQVKLHNTNTRILQKEIDVLKPTLIVFLGWHWKSLEMELPYTSKKLRDGYENRKNHKCICGDIPCVFTYHPSAHMSKKYAMERIALVKSFLK